MGRRKEFSGRIGLATCVLLGMIVAAVVPGVLAAGPQSTPAAVALVSPPAELVSVNPVVPGFNNLVPSISADGSIVLFAEVLAAGAAQVPPRAWVRNRPANQITQVPQPAGSSGGVVHPALSRDGCHVAFWSLAGQGWTVFKWNRCAAGSNPVPISPPVAQDPAGGEDLAVSADGRFVAAIFGGGGDIRNQVVRIDTGNGNAVATVPELQRQFAEDIDISDDGGFVAVSAGTQTRALKQIIGWIPANGQLELISQAAGGVFANGDNNDPSVSVDGGRVAFTNAQNIDFPVLGPALLFVRDRAAGVTRPIPTPPGSVVGDFSEPDILPDGSQVAFAHDPFSPSVPWRQGTDNSAPQEVFVARSTAGAFDTVAIELVSFGVNDQPVTAGARSPAVSATGSQVAFGSSAGAELGGANQGRIDIWLRNRAALTMTPTLNFGVVAVGGNSQANTVVRNASNVNIPVAIGPPAAPFSISADGCSGVVLAPGQTCALTIRYAPTAPVSSASQVTASGEGASAATQLSGTGTTNPDETTPPTQPPTIGTNPTNPTIPPTTLAPGRLSIAPPNVDFGAVVAGTVTETQALTVTNIGGSPVSITGAGFSGGGSDQFAFDFVGCAGRTLAVNATCTVEVAATPTRAGASSATFTVRGSGDTSASATLNVLGQFTPTLLVRPGVLRPGEVGTVTGQGFPANSVVELAFSGEAPFASVTTDAGGALSTPLLVLVNGRRIGGQVLVAVNQPGVFTGVQATFLVELATFAPSGANTLIPGLRALVYRNG